MGKIIRNGITYGGGSDELIQCTQAQYDAWEQAGTIDPTKLYCITDASSGSSLIDDSTTSQTKTWSSDKIDDQLDLKANASSTYTKSEVDTALSSSSLRSTLLLANFCVYSAERIMNNSSKQIPLTQNLFVLFFKCYSSATTYGLYLISYHPSVGTDYYISRLCEGSAYMPTVSIVDGNKVKIQTASIDIYYSMLRLN